MYVSGFYIRSSLSTPVVYHVQSIYKALTDAGSVATKLGRTLVLQNYKGLQQQQ